MSQNIRHEYLVHPEKAVVGGMSKHYGDSVDLSSRQTSFCCDMGVTAKQTKSPSTGKFVK